MKKEEFDKLEFGDVILIKKEEEIKKYPLMKETHKYSTLDGIEHIQEYEYYQVGEKCFYPSDFVHCGKLYEILEEAEQYVLICNVDENGIKDDKLWYDSDFTVTCEMIETGYKRI